MKLAGEQMFNLSSSQSDRINFDQAAFQAARNSIQCLTDSEINHEALCVGQVYNDDGGWIVDDVEEARARFSDAAALAITDEFKYRARFEISGEYV